MILLDTHALLWWVAQDRRLSSVAARAITRSDTIRVSPITTYEVTMLSRRNRIRLDRDVETWIEDLFALERVEAAPLSIQASVRAGQLPGAGFEGDPYDALLYSTAVDLAVPLVTRDRAIAAFARDDKRAKTIW